MIGYFRFCLAMASFLPAALPTLAAPTRVVSLNLCTDQLLVALAAPNQIAGLGRFSRDPDISAVAGQAKAFPRIGGGAETVLLQKPDLVLAGPYDRPVTSGALARQGIPTRIVELWQGFAKGEADILDLGKALGHPERAEALVAALQAARGRLSGLGHGRTALAIGRGGYIDGAASITGALIEAAGLRNLAADAPTGRFMPLEELLLMQPDIVVLAEGGEAASDKGAAFLRHPALRGWMQGRRVVHLPPRLTACPGPALVEALDRLGRALQD